VAAGLADRAVPFAANTPVVVVPETNPAGLSSPADLARPGLRIVAAAKGVPITSYAEELVAQLATEPGYPAGFTDAYDANVATREDNVGAVLAKVGLGEGDAGIVYATDARASADVRALATPAGVDVRATYAGAVITDSPNRSPAEAFMAWLVGPEAQRVLAARGFLPPPPSTP
jgi:molybdate transport system substrate-binding protein